VTIDPWDRLDGTPDPGPSRLQQDANDVGARAWSAGSAETHTERRGGRAALARHTPDEVGPWPRFLRVHLAWILLITLAVTAGAYLVAKAQKSIYISQAVVVVFAEAANASSDEPVIMATEKGIASSEAVMSIASRSLGISQTALLAGLSVSVPVDTDLLDFAFSDSNPTLARTAAEAVADAYIAFRTPTTVATTSKIPAPTVAGAVRPSIITPAPLPTSPSSPNRLLDVGVALLLGLSLGTGVALVRDAMDDRLRGTLDLETQANAAVLAQIPAFRRKRSRADQQLVMVHSPNSQVAEAYRDLRTRVLKVAAWGDTDTLLVTSLGREDKTTVAANVAAALALSGRHVILVCADLRWGRTHELFGLSNEVGLTTVLSGNTSPAGALQDTEIRRLQLLAAGPAIPDPAAIFQSPTFPRVLGQLRRRANFIVIDAPPVLANADTEALAELSGMILLVADARVSKRAQVRAATHRLGRASNDRIFCVFDNVGRPRSLPGSSLTRAAVSLRGSGKAKTGDLVVSPEAALNGHASLAAELPQSSSAPVVVDSGVGGGTER
jgi:polysaccharide biosynthesis transport protein